MLDSQVLLTLTLTCKQKSALKLIDWAKAIPNNLPKKRPLVPEVEKDFFLLSSLYIQGCISCGTCSYLELTEDHVLTSAYVKIFRIVTRNAVNKSF